MNETTIREAGKADLPAIQALYAQPDIDNGEMLPLDEVERIFARMSSHGASIYVAEQQGRIVGTFILVILEKFSHLGAPSAIVEDVAVAPEFQSHGIGRVMMAFAMKRATLRGCYKLALSSNMKRERAHAFYESLGFERHGYSFAISL